MYETATATAQMMTITIVRMNPFLVAMPLFLLFTAVLAAEIRLLRWATWAYALQGWLMAAFVGAIGFSLQNHALYWWAGMVAAGKGLILPWLLTRYRGATAQQEVGGQAFGLSVLVTALIALLAYVGMNWSVYTLGVQIALPVAAAVAGGILAVGLWTLLAHRDTLKVVIGVCLLENGAHLLLVGLAPGLPETAEFGIVTDVVVAVWLLLLVARHLASRNSDELQQLRG